MSSSLEEEEITAQRDAAVSLFKGLQEKVNKKDSSTCSNFNDSSVLLYREVCHHAHSDLPTPVPCCVVVLCLAKFLFTAKIFPHGHPL